MLLRVLPKRLCITLLLLPLQAWALTPAEVFEQVKDSVFVVRSYTAEGAQFMLGSAILLPTGKIATNCHVVKGAATYQVGRGKQFIPATLYAGDDVKDICLLDAPNIVGTPAQLGQAASLKVGVPVYAIGAPQGLELSLSDGIVSQLRDGIPPIIQTTAAISHGSSGGGLFDSSARLVGLTTRSSKDAQTLNFAMPVEWVAEIKPANSANTAKGSISAAFKEPEMVPITSLGIALGKYEVTQGQWRSIMGNNPSGFASCGNDCPVEFVSWNEVQDFIERLNRRTGKQYRLPSENEWYAACQSGGTHEFCGSDSIDAVAWYGVNSSGHTHPVGQKAANALGIHDMSGNVWEWMLDCYDGNCALRTIRGGSWGISAVGVKPGIRGKGNPASRGNMLGFRLALDL